MSDLTQAMSQLADALMSDESYYDSWVANIAMAIHDTPRKAYPSEHAWRQGCARAFLSALTIGHPKHPFAGEDAPGAMLAAVAHTVNPLDPTPEQV